VSNNDNTDINISADERLAQAIDALPREISPERDLWPELASQLPARAVPTRTPIWAAVAALLAITVSFWLYPTSNTPAPSTAANYSTATKLALIYEQEEAVQLSQLSSYTPSINRQLAIWEDAIKQVESALQYYPEQQQLLAQLNQLYQQELRYIGELSQQPHQIASLY